MQRSKPGIRWRSFAKEISGADIDYQLDWMVDTGFGFVEIAWVYPLDDGSSAAEWLSPEWGNPAARPNRFRTTPRPVLRFLGG